MTAGIRDLKPVQPDVPEEGYYKGRLVKGGVFVAIRIWFGPPLDPLTGEELDRSHRWQAERNGAQVEVEAVWPYCAAHRIDKAEHDYLLATSKWAVENDPSAPEAAPRQAIDLNAIPPLF